MRSNPNETFGSRVEDFVRPGSLVTFVLPRVEDQEHFAHEIRTVLGDLLEFDVAVQAHDLTAKGGSVIVSSQVKYPAGIAKVDDALRRVAERYGAESVVWSWGPYNRVQVADHNPLVED